MLSKIGEIEKLVAELRYALVAKQPELEIARTMAEVDDLVKNKVCLRCGKPIGKKKHTRGIHENCYQKLRRDGELERAEANGRILAAGKPGPRSSAALKPLIENVISQKRITNKKTPGRDGDQ